MELNEVQKVMLPGAKEALKRGISMDEAREEFTRTLFSVAIEESGEEAIAARRLGVSTSLITMFKAGKVYKRFRGKREKSGVEQK